MACDSNGKRLPWELEHDILLKLPADDLLRSRCVCKLWCNTIDCPSFVDSHTSRIVNSFGKANDENSSFILTCSNKRGMSSSQISSFSIDCCPLEETKKPTIKPQKNSLTQNFLLAGSCNGLLCLANFNANLNVESFVLYNPVTDEFKLTPSFDTVGRKVQIGFAYDSVNCDYKIVCSSLLKPKSHKYQVYSLKNNSWNNIELAYPNGTHCKARSLRFYELFIGSRPTSMILTNNVWHQIIVGDESHMITSRFILGFDLGSEQIHTVPMPLDNKEFYSPAACELADLRGCLHLITFNGGSDYPTEIWIMKEYGVKKSWTKMISFTQETVCALQPEHTEMITPYAYSKDGREILVGIGKPVRMFLRYDLRSRVFNKFEISVQPSPPIGDMTLPYSYTMMPWAGSFVSPHLFE